jgi:glycine cleavage system aminomethyltransferase T
MTSGEPEIDPHGSDIARFYDHHRTAQHIAARTTEGYNKTYGIVHPQEQWASNRPIKLSPAYERQKALGAEFFEAAGWERPYWYNANKPLLDEYGDRVMPRAAEWESRWWSPIINAEHLAMRDRVGMVDLSAFVIFDVTGPGACDYLERLCVNRVDVPVGRTVYTPLLNGSRRDPRRPHDHAPGPRPLPRRDRRRHGHARQEALHRRAAGGRLGAAPRRDEPVDDDRAVGPAGARRAGLVTSDDVSSRGFPFLTSKAVDIDGVRTLASRISYVGELGWEIYVPIEQGLRVWDAIWEAGKPHGLAPVGIGTYAVTARIEKGYRAHGAELELDFDLVEAGMARPTVKDADFVGREAYLRQRSEAPVAVLCTLTVDDPDVEERRQALHAGPRADRHPRRRAADRREGPAVVRDLGGFGPVDREAPADGLPAARPGVEGNQLAVEYFGELYPVTVAVAGATPLFDPENARIRS